jgi:RNA polymerase sigma-70 factor (ECF subfamily)
MAAGAETLRNRVKRDRKLVLRVRQGDQKAFRELFDSYHPLLFRFCARYASLDRYQVADMVQQSFMKAYEHIDDLKDAGRFSSWLFMIARNLVISSLRQRKAERSALAQITEDPACMQDDVDPYFREQLHQAVERAVQAVADETTSRIASLYYGPERITTQEIADRLAIPKGTVTVKLQRLRKRVHRRLALELLDHQLPWSPFRESDDMYCVGGSR